MRQLCGWEDSAPTRLRASFRRAVRHLARMFACGAPTDCLQMRRVAANVCVGHASPSACDESCSTCTSNASFCAGCDAGAGVYLTDNAWHSSAELVGKCLVFAADGGCRVCNDGYYIHEKTCIACDGLYPGAIGTCERLPLATDAQRATTRARHARSTRRSVSGAMSGRGCS